MTTEYLLETEVQRVLMALTPVNRLVVRTMLHTGLRVGDVLALRSAQLGRRFWITEAKTGKRRQVAFPDELLADLRAQAGKTWVFESARDPAKHRTRQAVWKDIKRAAKAFRLPQNVGTHSMRKVYAVRLMGKYGDIKRVQRALQHSSPATTLIYAMAVRSCPRGTSPGNGSVDKRRGSVVSLGRGRCTLHSRTRQRLRLVGEQLHKTMILLQAFALAKVEQNKIFVALSHKICYHITIESKYGAWAGAMGGFWGCV